MSAPSAPDRVAAFDAVRVLAALMTFLFHVAHVFDVDPTGSIKNAEASMAASLFSALGTPWAMPVFFLLAGIGSWRALERRRTLAFLRERGVRLLLPLVFGTFFLIPWNGYLSARNHRTFEGSFWSWLPVHVEQTREWLRVPAHQGLISFYYTSWHLWFLGFLFVFSVVALPLFRWGSSPRGRRISSLVGACAAGRWGLAALAVPFVVLRCTAGALGLPHESGARTTGFFLYFVMGWLFMTDARFLEAVRRQGRAWVIVGAGCTSLLVASVPLGYLARWLLHPTPSLDYAVGEALWALNAHAWVLGLLGCALRRWQGESSLLAYLAGAGLPFYILHQVVLFTVASVVVETSLGLGTKMLLTTVLAFGGTMALCELVIRRSSILRPLFGLRAKAPSPPRAAAMARAL